MKSAPMQLHGKGEMKKTSTALEKARPEEASRKQREVWLEENREGIESYNELVARHGAFSHGVRGF